MSDRDKLRGIIAEIAREEIEEMMSEAKEEVEEIVRTEFLPRFRAANRETILSKVLAMKNIKPIWKVILLIGVLLATALPLGTFGSQVLAQEPKTWYVDDDLADYPNADFTRIQDAVNAANAGDTIIVYRGTYTENVDVNKDRLTIKSESGAEKTIVQAVSCCFKIYLSCPKEG
jgi:hypothetical protein